MCSFPSPVQVTDIPNVLQILITLPEHLLRIYLNHFYKKNVPKFQTSERTVALVLFVDWNSWSFSFQPEATDSKANTVKLSQTGLFSPSASIFLTRDPCGPCQKLVRRVSSNG